MGKIKQNTNLRHWASLWFVMAMAVMTAIFLRGGIVVQAEENDSSLSVSGVYMIGDEEYDYEYDLPSLSVGDEVTFKVRAEGGTGNYNYQWYYVNFSDEGNTYEPVEEAQQDTLTVEKKKMTAETYYCEVKDDGDNQEAAWFYIPTIPTLTTTSYINDEETTIIEARENDEVSMRVVAESIMDNPDYTYSWYKYDEETGESESADCQADTLTITKSDKNEIYLCYVSDGVNRETCSFYINLKSTVTINKRTYIINGESYDAEDDSLPSLSIGDNITLQVDAETSIEDGDVSYQWYHYVKSDDEEYGNYEKISGETSNTLAITKEKLESEEYYCEVSDKKTSTTADFSIPSVETLSITKGVNDEEDTGSYTTTKGASVTMKVNATSVLGDDKISYQWYGPDDELLEGETGPTCTVTKGTGYEDYYCYVSDTVNQRSCWFSLEIENTITSVKTYINDREEYSVSNVNPGKKYTLKVEPVSKNKEATYSYSWYTYNSDGERENLGEDSPELEVTKTKAVCDTYYVDITSDDGSGSNGYFSLYRKPIISILAYVNGEYAASGDGNYSYCYVDSSKDLKLREDAKSTADGDITYQWSKGAEDDGNVEPIDEATEAQYTAPAFDEERESYTCTVTCDGYSMNYGFYLIKKDSSSEKTDIDVNQYILVNGVKADDDSEVRVYKDSKVTLGVNVSNLPEGIKEEDIKYEWYEIDPEDEDDKLLYVGREYTISSISKYVEYCCCLMVNGERLVNSNIEFCISVNPDVTTEITVDGEKLGKNSTSMGVDSFEDLYGKDVTIKATDRTNPNAKFTYEWFKEERDGEKDQSISKTSECRLNKEILSGYDVNLYCVITDENGSTQKEYLNLYVYDSVDNGNKYINGEEADDNSTERYKAGEKVTLKVSFSENTRNKLTYQWYDNDWKKTDCQKDEYTITKGENEETYTCVVTDQYNRSMSYDFTLYPITKFVVKRYVNGKKINKTWYKVGSEETLKLEVKASPDDNVTYQWYQGEYSKEELKGETKSVLSVKVPDKAEELDDYRCVVTRGNERQWVYFNLYRCNHSDTEVLPAVPATCEKDGLTEGKRCTDCGEIIVKQEVVKATGHKWNNGKVTTPATTTATGVKTYTCSVCKKTKTEVIPKLPATDKPSDNSTKKPETTDGTTKTLKTGTKITDKKSKAVYKVTANKTVQYTKASDKKAQKAKKVTVPSTVTVNGVKYQVTAIAANAFKNNKNLKSIVIPESVRTIGKQAFAGCKNLKSITIKTPYLTKKSVGAKAFKGISTKATIKVPKKQLKAYKKLLKAKGVAKSVKIK